MAKLLVITQKVDLNDDVLGFVHRWLEKFSEKFEKITVICLWKGKYGLPDNVRVLSLGKEKGRSRARYLKNFYKHIFRYRKEYDAVFVHMNPIYIVLGGLLWRLWGKRIGLWYNHGHGDWRTRLAVKFAHLVFHTSPYAFVSGNAKSHRMPAGIDTVNFSPDQNTEKIRNSILYIGRIAPIKRVDDLVKAAQILDRSDMDFVLDIYGGHLPEHTEYYKKIAALAKPLGEKIRFHGPVPNRETPDIYRKHMIFVNLTPAGNYDKTVLEAMACQTLVVASSPAFKDLIPTSMLFKSGSPEDLAAKLKDVFLNYDNYRMHEQSAREIVLKNHNVDILSDKLLQFFR